MNQIVDPSTGQVTQPSNPNVQNVPCECGYVNEVEVFPPRFINMRQTSIVVLEHAGPFMCPGCVRLVTVSVVGARGVIQVCMPVTSKPILAGAPKNTAEMALDGEPGESREAPLPPINPNEVM